MAPLSRKAPGSRAATILVFAALTSRLPLFPSIAMVRSQHAHGGDSIRWGFELTTLADHLRYEGSWASHRAPTAFLVDAAHPILVLSAGSFAALGLLALVGRLPRRARVIVEGSVRRAMVWACGFFVIVVGLKTSLSFGVVRGPRPLLLGVIGALVFTVLVLAVWGRRASWPRIVLRTGTTLLLGVPLIASLLALFAIGDARHLPHVPFAWALGVASFFAGARLLAWARRRLPQSTLR